MSGRGRGVPTLSAAGGRAGCAQGGAPAFARGWLRTTPRPDRAGDGTIALARGPQVRREGIDGCGGLLELPLGRLAWGTITVVLAELLAVWPRGGGAVRCSQQWRVRCRARRRRAGSGLSLPPATRPRSRGPQPDAGPWNVAEQAEALCRLGRHSEAEPLVSQGRERPRTRTSGRGLGGVGCGQSFYSPKTRQTKRSRRRISERDSAALTGARTQMPTRWSIRPPRRLRQDDGLPLSGVCLRRLGCMRLTEHRSRAHRSAINSWAVPARRKIPRRGQGQRR